MIKLFDDANAVQSSFKTVLTSMFGDDIVALF